MMKIAMTIMMTMVVVVVVVMITINRKYINAERSDN